MPKDFESVDEYIALQPEGVRETLALVRGVIRKAVPAAEEAISYKIPTYKLQDVPLIYFAAWKKHYSLYPITGRVLTEFQDELAHYEVNKSTIRFAYSQPVPVKLIARIVKFRVKDVALSADRR
ncbi:MAG: DUF1801 domain-containing protein [Bryobacteraceae bacterium]